MIKFKNHFISMLAVFSLASCGTTPPPTSTIAEAPQIKSVEEDKSALIIMDVLGQSCERSVFSMINTDTSEKKTFSVAQISKNRFARLSMGQPALVEVPPGTYQLTSGSCLNKGYHPIGYAWMNKWFAPFEVDGGDVRYLGSLGVSAAKGLGKQSVGNEVINRVFNMGLNQRTPAQYAVLQFIDLKTRSKEVLLQHYPELADRMVFDPPPKKVDAKEFRKVVSDAFAEDENGNQLSTAEGRKKIAAYMNAIE